tara:strand:- start:2172 stop:2459 length:288 start_codon:yes stop_codon:yes gene_type:complete
MCGCSDKNSVDLQKIKLYLIMAKYEVKKKWLGKGTATNFTDGNGSTLSIGWDNASQNDMARAYEEFNGAEAFINKIEKSSEKAKTKKPSKDISKD